MFEKWVPFLLLVWNKELGYVKKVLAILPVASFGVGFLVLLKMLHILDNSQLLWFGKIYILVVIVVAVGFWVQQSFKAKGLC
jgi:hypothetical protein